MPVGTTLSLASNVIIDAGANVSIDGTLQCTGSITVSGSGKLQVNSTGEIVTSSSVVLTIAPGTTLYHRAGSSATMGYNSALTVNGKLIAIGSYLQPVIFNSNNRYKGSWNKIGLYGGPDTLQYCTIKYANWGAYINNLSANYIDHCTFDSCLNAGVYAISANSTKGALTILYSNFYNSYRGVGVVNGRADVQRCSFWANNQGLTAANAIVYLKWCEASTNSTVGSYISGATSSVYFCADDWAWGCNNFWDDEQREVYIISSGYAFLGDYVPGSGRQYGGSNNIMNSGGYLGKLVYNGGRASVPARKCYWGTDSTGGWYGVVDHSYKLTDYGCGMMQIAARSEVPASTLAGDPTEKDISSLISALRGAVDNNEEDAAGALHWLVGLVGPGAMYQSSLGTSWREFLANVQASASASSYLKSIATAYYIHSFFVEGDAQTVLSLTKSALEGKPDADLWLFCQSEQVSAMITLGKNEEAQTVLASIKDRISELDPEMVKILQDIVVGSGTRKGGTLPSIQIPPSFSLQQNYPNPFNPTTRFEYTLPTAEHVTLRVYNVLGQEVATLVDDELDPGYKSISFDASSLPSGIYFYRLQAGNFTAVKKMILAK